MEIKNNGWSVKQLTSMAEKGSIEFEYAIQRSGGVWKPLQQSYLIHSLAQDYPIPPVYFLGETKLVDGKEKPLRYILDGKQRITTMVDFVADKFSLHKDTPMVTIEGEHYFINGCTFSEMDEAVQDMVLSRTILTYTLDSKSVTDEEIEDLFFRMNNGSALTIQQKSKALMGVEWATKLNELGHHTLITDLAAFSASQLKNDAHLTAILQTMMMMDSHFKDYKNVSQKVISEYGTTFKEDSAHKEVLFNKVREGMNYLVNVFDKKEGVLLKKTHFPMTVMTALRAMQLEVQPDEFYSWANCFKEAIKPNQPSVTYVPTTYVQYTGTGTTDRPKADGRMNEMIRHMETYVKMHPSN